MANKETLIKLMDVKADLEQAVLEVYKKHGLKPQNTEWSTRHPSIMMLGLGDEMHDYYMKVDISIKK